MYKIIFSKDLECAGVCDHDNQTISLKQGRNKAATLQIAIHEFLHEFSNYQDDVNLESESDINFLSTFLMDRLVHLRTLCETQE